jgi:type II secretory pathway predicted ATPase ExeA
MNHLKYWNINESPFGSVNSKEQFFCAGTVDEAMARIGFLVQNRRKLGLLVGQSGSGKSTTLTSIQFGLPGTLDRHRMRAASLSLLGLSSGEFPRRLLAKLTPHRNRADQQVRRAELVWRDIEDECSAAGAQEQRIVVALDDSEAAQPPLWVDVVRLLSLPGPLTIVMGCTPMGISSIVATVLERCELKLDLPSWDLAQTASYFEWALARVRARDDLFDAQAITRVQELSNGLPRRITQISELALAAGAVRRMEQITGVLIDQVADELLAIHPDAHNLSPILA